MGKKSKSVAGKRGSLQALLPLFPEDITMITRYVGVQKRDHIVYYFNGSMPIFQHEQEDLDGFRYITSQLGVNGNCKQVDIVNCFGVSAFSVKRWVKPVAMQPVGYWLL